MTRQVKHYRRSKKGKRFKAGRRMKSRNIFPKPAPFYAIQPEDIIQKEGTEVFGKLQGDKTWYAVEDPYTLSRYDNKEEAITHFKDNVRISEELKKEGRAGRRMKSRRYSEDPMAGFRRRAINQRENEIDNLQDELKELTTEDIMNLGGNDRLDEIREQAEEIKDQINYLKKQNERDSQLI